MERGENLPRNQGQTEMIEGRREDEKSGGHRHSRQIEWHLISARPSAVSLFGEILKGLSRRMEDSGPGLRR